MHEDAPIIEASTRSKVGTRYAQRLRKSGKLPAVVYGHKQEPVSIELDKKSTVRLLTDGDRIFRMRVDGAEPEFMLLKDLQFDYLGTDIMHADFARVDLDERVDVRIHVSLRGEAVGLKTAGTVLIHPTNEIEIECSLFNMPEEIEVDISHLGVNESITAGEVTLPKPTMVLRTDPKAIIARIVETREEVDAEAAEVSAAPTPVVLTEKKKDE